MILFAAPAVRAAVGDRHPPPLQPAVRPVHRRHMAAHGPGDHLAVQGDVVHLPGMQLYFKAVGVACFCQQLARQRHVPWQALFKLGIICRDDQSLLENHSEQYVEPLSFAAAT